MNRFTGNGRLVLAALVAFAAAGCDSSRNVTEPHANPAESEFIAFEESVETQARAAGIEPDAPAPNVMPQRSSGGGDWVFVQGSAGDVSVEAVIDARGGVLNLGPHWLLVPRDAVRGATRFRMTPISDGTFHVDLTATTVRAGREVLNDAGRTGFPRPVYLAFHIADQPLDHASLNVAWLTPGDQLVPQQTFIYEEDWAVGVLRHFSGYVLVGN